MKLFITCNEATDFISRKEEGKLTLLQRLHLAIHLFICTFCRLFYKQSRLIIRESKHLHEHIDATLTQQEKEAMSTRLMND